VFLEGRIGEARNNHVTNNTHLERLKIDMKKSPAKR
jgi:hypothetical protein